MGGTVKVVLDREVVDVGVMFDMAGEADLQKARWSNSRQSMAMGKI